MKFRPLLVSAVVIVGSCVSTLQAQLYWDINGATAGATDDPGGLAAGNWDGVSTNWTTDATGASSTGVWTAGQSAVFSAGTNASGNYSVTVSGTQSVGNITFQEGTVTLTGGQLNLTATGSPADYNGDGVVDAADYPAWRKLPGTFGGDPAGYNAWRTDFGSSGGAGGGTITTATGTTHTINSVVGGTLALTKAGADRLILGGANVYSGGTNVNVGTLQFAKTNSMPVSGAVSVLGGATLSVNAGGAGEWTNATSGGGSIGGLIAGTGGQGTANQITWADGSNLGIDTTNATGGTLSYSGVIGSFRGTSGNTNAVGLTKRGAGTLLLTGANTYTGRTTMTTNGGILKLGATNTLPAATVISMPAAANSNTRVELFNDPGSGLTYYDQTVAGLSDGAGGAVATSGVVDVGFATLTLDVPTGQSHTYGGFLKTDYDDDPSLIQGRVIKEGDGEIILTLNQGNTFGGEFVVREGRVGIGAGQAFGGTTSSTLRIEGGTLAKSNASASSLSVNPRTVTIAGDFTFDMTGSEANAQLIPATPGIGFGGINLAANSTITVTSGTTTFPAGTPLGFVPSFILTRAGAAGSTEPAISDGAGSFGITKAGPGTLSFDRPNDYNGGTTIAEGVLRLSAQGGATGVAATMGDGPVTLAGGTLEYTGAPIGGVRRMTINNAVTMTASSTISLRGGSGASGLTPAVEFVFPNITGSAGTLTLQNNGNSNEPNAATPTVNPVEFRVEFSGNSTFTRPIVISNHPTVANRTTVLVGASSGTQTFSGDLSGNGGVIRNADGGTTILSGNNTYTGNTVIDAGTLSITSPYLADSADVLFVTAGAGSPILDLNFPGTSTIDTIDQLFIDGAAQATGTWGAPGAVALGADFETPLITGDGWLLVTDMGSGPGAVPEPGSLVLAIMTVFAFGGLRRRRGAL